MKLRISYLSNRLNINRTHALYFSTSGSGGGEGGATALDGGGGAARPGPLVLPEGDAKTFAAATTARGAAGAAALKEAGAAGIEFDAPEGKV